MKARKAVLGRWGVFLALAAVLSTPLPGRADTDVLSCTENTSAGTAWSCENFGTVAAKANVTYQLAVQPSDAQYQRFDVNITLTSLSGDADLLVHWPGNAPPGPLVSNYNVGQDIVFVNRAELQAGEFTVAVVGFAASSQFRLNVELVLPVRQLRPVAQITMGQIVAECCSVDEAACSGLLATHPDLGVNPDTSFNFCNLHGNVCTRDGYLLELAMPGVDFACVFPSAQLSVLKRLRRLDLSGSRLIGNISGIATTLASLPELQYVNLGYNMLDGQLDHACNLTSTRRLAQLNLMNNALSGSIPACIASLPQLVELHLDFNQLTGSLPAPVANSPLVYLTAAFQMGLLQGLSGALPAALGALPSLTYVDLGGNMLSGRLPEQLPSSLQSVRLSGNFLTGTIPASYGNLHSLKSLEMGKNALSGSIPDGVAALPALKLLDLSDNFLSGPLPSDWSKATQVSFMLLENNAFSGLLPSSIATMNNLVVCNLDNNVLTGTLDDFAFYTIANREDLHSRLRYFDIGNNSFVGDLNNAEGMKRLGLFSDVPDAVTSGKLLPSGSTSAALSRQSVVRTFDLEDNGFTGEFPLWLVEVLATSAVPVLAELNGNILTCPANGFPIAALPPPGRLDNLTCYAASTALAVNSNTPRVSVMSLVYVPSRRLSGGAIAAIVFAALLGAALLAGGAYWLLQRRRAASASAAGFGQFRDSAPQASGPSRTAASFPGASGGSKARLATQMHADARAYERDNHEVELGSGGQGYGGAPGFKVSLKGGSHLQLP
ncbi:hypothetical protein WJX81_003310 [Elliptochloris bilobata]|uniref:Uncharacterized protein n=1 Tax=Elliptochloris bilobata TaxID=381761 RepID=A0AAW1S0W8_9CHLO